MNWLKRTLGICALSVSLLFGGTIDARAETLEIVFKSSLWGAAIGGVSGLAFWALQEEDKEDKSEEKKEETKETESKKEEDSKK